MRWWEQQVGGAVRGRVIALVRRGVCTVDEMAVELGVTDNAVRAHLQTLEDAGIVQTAGTRQSAGAGKPATLYRIVPSAEAELSSAYAPVLVSLLESLGDRLTPRVLNNVLRDTGRRLGEGHARSGASLETRVRAAAAQLTALGAEIDVVKTPDGFQLRGYACPLSAAVRTQPHACHVVEELVSSLVGVPVRECCDRTDGARCRFDVLARSA
jgi:predicted ArsR family transcriptional regulator